MISCVVHLKPLYLMAGDPSRLHRDKGKILAKDYVEEDKRHWNSSITAMLFFFLHHPLEVNFVLFSIFMDPSYNPVFLFL